MKKTIQLVIIAYLSLILLIIGCTNINNTTNNEIGPAAFAFLLVIWIFAIVSAIPLLKAKERSNLLLSVAFIQIFLTPINAILGIVLLVLHKKNKINLKFDFETRKETKNAIKN